MAAITGFAYTILKKQKLEDNRKIVHAQITAGNGSLTYPANGIPLDYKQLGFVSGFADSVVVADANSNGSADGFLYKWDNVNKTLRAYQAPASGPNPLAELGGAATPTVNVVIEAIGY